MKPIQEILVLISNKEISDNIAKKEIEELGTIPTEIERNEILNLLKTERPTLYQNWMLEVASSYM